jgi:hypothetical protein
VQQCSRFSSVLGEEPVVARAANVKSPIMFRVRGAHPGGHAPGGRVPCPPSSLRAPCSRCRMANWFPTRRWTTDHPDPPDWGKSRFA